MGGVYSLAFSRRLKIPAPSYSEESVLEWSDVIVTQQPMQVVFMT